MAIHGYGQKMLEKALQLSAKRFPVAPALLSDFETQLSDSIGCRYAADRFPVVVTSTRVQNRERNYLFRFAHPPPQLFALELY